MTTFYPSFRYEDAPAAIEWLEKAYRDRRGWLAYLKIEPILDGLRPDDVVQRILGSVPVPR